MPADVPALPGVLSAAEVRATGAAIAATAEPSGAVPWTPGGPTDVWNHVEAAMAMLVAGQVEAAEAAYAWVGELQRADGSLPLRLRGGEVEDASGETNMSAYLAVGVWHHWLVRRDAAFVRRCWPVVRSALGWVVRLQLPFGGISWSQEWRDGAPAEPSPDALLAGSSSVYHALRAGVALADLVGEPQPEWELAAGRLGHALRVHPDRFLDKSSFAMDWYYPVLGGAVRGRAGSARIDRRWGDFVVPGLGVRCVDTNPWVTAAETAELVLALDALGRRREAMGLLGQVQHLRAADGSYWTGWVFEPEGAHWPEEQSSYTAAAVVLAVDALSYATPGTDVVRGAALPAPPDVPHRCGCESDRDARIPVHAP